MTKQIQLTGGKVALVDDDVFEELSKHKWNGSSKYATRLENKDGKVKQIFMHREIMNPPEDMEVDHINHNKLDNRRCNLRVCTKSQNQWNQLPYKKVKSSKYKGVDWFKEKKRWRAQIRFHNQRIYLGKHQSEEAAARAYDKKARELFGEFACVNFPTTPTLGY